MIRLIIDLTLRDGKYVARVYVYKRGTNYYDYYDSLLKSTILSLFSYVLARCATMGLLHPLVFAIDICRRIC